MSNDNPYETALAQESSGKPHENVLMTSSNPYESALSQSSLGKHPESILKEAVRSATSNIISPNSNPLHLASMMNPALGMYLAAHNAKSEMLKEINPGHPVQNFAMDIGTDPETYMGMGSLGKGIGKMSGEIGGIFKQIPNVLTKSARVKTVENFGERLSKMRWSDMVDWFGGKIDDIASRNPDETVNIRNLIDETNVTSAWNPALKGLIERNPALRNIANNPSIAENMPLREVQQLKNELGTIAKRGPFVREASKFVGGIGEAISNKFEEMGPVYKEFGEKANQYGLFSPAFRARSSVENVLGSRNLLSFIRNPQFLGGEGAQIALKEFAPSIEKEIGQARMANKLVQAAKIATLATLAGKYAKHGYRAARELTD